MIVSAIKTSPAKSKGGFTLTELAIVLSLVGLVLSGIWIAAGAVYANFKAEELTRALTLAAGNMSILSTESIGAASDLSSTDNCGSVPPCSTYLLWQAGVFESDFITPGVYVSGASYGAGSTIFQTKFGYPVWTGIENGEVYASQAGSCPPSGCPSAPTVLEIDLFGLSTQVCMNLLMSMINNHVNYLYSITTTTEGWGPMTLAYGGNPSLPVSMPASTAAEACTPGAGDYSYDTSNQAQIWIWFLPIT